MNCRDIDASLRFYTEVLDFAVKVAPHPDINQFDGRHAVLGREGDLLHLDCHQFLNTPETAVFGTQIYIRTAQVDVLCATFIERGLSLDVPSRGNAPVDQTWGMREFGFRDPDGNKISYGEPIAG